MNIKDLLPIGSIVVLKDGEQPLMIYGIMQSDGERTKFLNELSNQYEKE